MEHVIIAQLRAVQAGALSLAALAAPEHATLAASLGAGADATLAAAIALLESWGDGPAAEPEDATEADDGVCRHPKDKRKSIATHGNPDAWLCLGCDFIHDGGTPDA